MTNPSQTHENALLPLLLANETGTRTQTMASYAVVMDVCGPDGCIQTMLHSLTLSEIAAGTIAWIRAVVSTKVAKVLTASSEKPFQVRLTWLALWDQTLGVGPAFQTECGGFDTLLQAMSTFVAMHRFIWEAASAANGPPVAMII
jgi:hypothetical protein